MAKADPVGTVVSVGIIGAIAFVGYRFRDDIAALFTGKSSKITTLGELFAPQAAALNVSPADLISAKAGGPMYAPTTSSNLDNARLDVNGLPPLVPVSSH